MGATALADRTAALSLMFSSDPAFVSQINRKVGLLAMLEVLPGEGKNCSFVVEFSGQNNAAASAEGVQRSHSDADAEIKKDATLAWAQYDKTASVTDLVQNATASNFRSETAGALGGDTLAGDVMGAAQRVVMGMASDLYGGDETASPVELAGAALAVDSSGTFAGIAPGTYSEWASTENAIASAELSIAKIREELITPIYDACGEVPDVLVTTSAIFDQIAALLGDKESSVTEITLAGGVKKLAAGQRALSIDGIPLIKDKDCTSATIYGFNSSYIRLRQLLPPQFRELMGAARPQTAILDFLRMVTGNAGLQLPKVELEGMAGRLVGQMGVGGRRLGGLMPIIKPLGARGLSEEASIYIHGQVEWLRRNAHGKLTLT